MKFLLFSLFLAVVLGAPQTSQIFRSFDVDRNGCLSVAEFTNAGTAIGLSAEAVQEWFTTSDSNSDNCIDANEFTHKLVRWSSSLYSKALNRANGERSTVVNAKTPAVGASPSNMLFCKFEDQGSGPLDGFLGSKCSTCMKRGDYPTDDMTNIVNGKFPLNPGVAPAYYNRACQSNVDCPSNQCIGGYDSCLPQSHGAPCANDCDCGSLHCSSATDNAVVEGTCQRSGSFCAILCSGVTDGPESEPCNILCHHREEAYYLNGPFIGVGTADGLPVVDAILSGVNFDENLDDNGEPKIAEHPNGDRGSADPLPGSAYIAELEVEEADLELMYSVSCDVNGDCSSGRCHPVWNWCMASHYGGRCETDFDCYGLQCREDKTCGKSYPGVWCNKDSECDSNHCHRHICQASSLGEICLHNYDCWSTEAGSELFVCRTHGSHTGDGYGVCSGGVGAACRYDDQCASGECHNHLCIESGYGGDCETDDDCGSAMYQQPSNNCPLEPALKCVYEDGRKHRGTCRHTPCDKLSCDPNACCFSETTKCVVHQSDRCPVMGSSVFETGYVPPQIPNSDTDFHVFSITFELFPQVYSFGVVSKGYTCNNYPVTPVVTDGWGVFVDANGFVTYQDFHDQYQSSVKVPLNRASTWSVSLRGIQLEICRTDLPKCACARFDAVDQYRMAPDIPFDLLSQSGDCCNEYVGPITINVCLGGLSYQPDFIVDSRAQTEHVSDTAFCKCRDDKQGSGLLGANSNCAGGVGDTCAANVQCSSGSCVTTKCAANLVGGVCGADTDCATTDVNPISCLIPRGDSSGTCAVDNCGVLPADGGCSDHATCSVQRNGRTRCECNDGYFGSGRGVSGCVNPCDNNGECGINAICLPVSRYERKCRCLPGYFEDDNQCVNPCLDGSNGGCPPLSECSAKGAHKRDCRCVFPLFSPFTQNTTRTVDKACVADLCLVPDYCKFDDPNPNLKQYCVFNRLEATSTCVCFTPGRAVCQDNCVADHCQDQAAYCSPLALCSLNSASCVNECACPDGYTGDGIGPSGCVASKCTTPPNLTGILHASVGTCDGTQSVGSYCELSCLPGFTVSRKPMAQCVGDFGADTATYRFEPYSCTTLPATHKLRGLTGWVCDAQDVCHPKAPTVGYKHEHVHYPGNQLGIHWIALGQSVTELVLFWTQVFPTGGPTQNSGPILNPAFATSYDVTGLVRGATYSFALHATTESETFISFPLTITF